MLTAGPFIALGLPLGRTSILIKGVRKDVNCNSRGSSFSSGGTTSNAKPLPFAYEVFINAAFLRGEI